MDSPSRRRRDSWVSNPPAKASVGNTKSVCVIGAGHVGAPHAIMMAKKCPSVKFTVVDDDTGVDDGFGDFSRASFEVADFQSELDAAVRKRVFG